MKKYSVYFMPWDRSYLTVIDTIEAPDGYTSEEYEKDCKENADEDWNELFSQGWVTVEEIEE